MWCLKSNLTELQFEMLIEFKFWLWSESTLRLKRDNWFKLHTIFRVGFDLNKQLAFIFDLQFQSIWPWDLNVDFDSKWIWVSLWVVNWTKTWLTFGCWIDLHVNPGQRAGRFLHSQGTHQFVRGSLYDIFGRLPYRPKMYLASQDGAAKLLHR